MGEWVTLADGSKLFCPYPLEQRPLREEESERGRHRGLALEGRGRDAAAPQGGQGEPRRRGDGRRLGLRRMDDDRGGGRVDGAHGRVDGGLRTKVLENWKT